MITLVLFAQVRIEAGTKEAQFDAKSVDELLDLAIEKFGPGFASVLEHCKIWCNEEPVERDAILSDGDVVALLPPISGGA